MHGSLLRRKPVALNAQFSLRFAHVGKCVFAAANYCHERETNFRRGVFFLHFLDDRVTQWPLKEILLLYWVLSPTAASLIASTMDPDEKLELRHPRLV